MGKIMEPPVCTEPKVFVGSIPMETQTEDITRVFGRYGKLKAATILTMPDGRSRGCAMLLFETWTAAEAAIEAENGSMNLGGAAGKGMIVKFADPPKRGSDGGPVVGLVPRKLFVGQVPSGTTQEALRGAFAPFGLIQDLHVVQKSMGAGCALLTYQKWASTEAAIEAHNGKTVLPGGTAPLVVRFADAKQSDGGGGGMNFGMMQQGMMGGFNGGGFQGQKRPFGANDLSMMQNSTKRQFGGGMGFMPGQQYGMQQGGFMPGMGQAYGMMQNAAAMNQMRMGMSNGGGGGEGGSPGMGGQIAGGMGMGGNRGMGLGANINGGFGTQAAYGTKGGRVDEVAKQWKLFVGQIPYQADESDLWPLFSAFGTILELTILRNAGKSKGCGFCVYESYTSAAAAAQQLNETACVDNDPNGRRLVVKFANPQAAALAAAGAQQVPAGAVGMQQQQVQQPNMLGGGMNPQQQQQQQQQQSNPGMMMMQGQTGQGSYLGPSPQMQGYQQQQPDNGMMMM